MTLTAAFCCSLTAVLFASCSDEETTYKTNYTYEIGNGRAVDYVETEHRAILAALYQAIGYDGNTFQHHSSKKDDEMKIACDAVKEQFNNIQSTYLTYALIRVTHDAANPTAERKKDTIAIYEFGRATQLPYIKYSFNTNEQEAKTQLNAIRDSIGDEIYKRTRRTFIRLNTEFTNSLGYWLTLYTPEDDQFQQQVAHICDSVANAHANDTLAVDFNVWVNKTGLLNNQTSDVWSHTFHANQ